MAIALTAVACHQTVPGPETPCRALASTPIEGVSVSSAAEVDERGDLPPFCAIRGTIGPGIGFEARLPLSGWNGRFYQSGCGGYCGAVLPDKPGYSNTINEALKKGYAAITTDGGHSAAQGDASWAQGNPVAVEVYAHRVIPLTYRAGTRMVELFYGRPPELEYFGGCSNGGRLAAMAAQRYPSLFDGILGGGAVLNLSQNGGIHGSWVVQSNTGPDGQRILTYENFADKLPALEAAVSEQCDATDGVVDGVISQPRNCAVDVGILPACDAPEAGVCFSAAEREVLRKWYQGAVDSRGRSLYPGMPAGSERYWAVWFLDQGGRVAWGNELGGDYAKYLGFEEGVTADYTALDFDFDRDPPRLEANGRQLNALDPDLSAFRDAGGKFLMWHGWQDPLVLPDQSVAYYESVVNELGGPDQVGDFFRLFMIPGQGHCWEIPSSLPDRFDPITVLDDWVRKGAAPARLTATALESETAPIQAAAICAWPELPVYFERGQDSSEAACRESSSCCR
jgi:feruloyl esterase